jgi:hypothetical protein
MPTPSFIFQHGYTLACIIEARRAMDLLQARALGVEVWPDDQRPRLTDVEHYLRRAHETLMDLASEMYYSEAQDKEGT